MNMRQALSAALRREPDLLPKIADRWRGKIDGDQGAMARVVQMAGAVEPVIADAVRTKPSRLGRIGLKSTHLLASLAAEDSSANRKLARIAHGSTVGIVFVDIAGFLTFTADHGDEAAVKLLARLNETIERVIKPCHGQVVKRLGDGFLLAFPSASQAVRGALSLKNAVRKGRGRHHLPVQLRIAVHAGEPLVEQDDLLGHDVNITARLLDHCDPGEVIVSETAKELAEKRLRKISFGPRREVKIRGLSTRVTTYSVNPADGPTSRSGPGTDKPASPRPRARAPLAS
jgi:class 3 adenylate cyclase